MENACMHDTGEFLMKIIKIVNNNIVTSLDEQNREIIVMRPWFWEKARYAH